MAEVRFPAQLLNLLILLLDVLYGSSLHVLSDIDWPKNCIDARRAGSSAEDCARQCYDRFDCVAVGWISTEGNCYFKCSTDGQRSATGEQGVVVRPGENRCHAWNASICPESGMPADWLQRCLSGQLLFSSDPEGGALPSIGNGYLATVVGSDSIYVAGLFNGKGHVHRARIPPYNVEVHGLRVYARALDLERAVYLSRARLSSGVTVETRKFAPLQAPNVLVDEIILTNPTDQDQIVSISSLPSDASKDLDLHPVQEPDSPEGDNVYAVAGRIIAAENHNRTSVAFVANKPPKEISVPAHSRPITVFAISVVVTSLSSKTPTEDALSMLHEYATDDFRRAKFLFAEHAAAWATRIETGRIEVEGDLRLAQAVNASLYAIRASIREDWPYGLSPGGLSTNGYGGHTFWDQETWMFPPLLMLEPASARSTLQFRANGMGAARTLAANCKSDNSAWATSIWCQPGFSQHLASEGIAFPWEAGPTGRNLPCAPWPTCHYEEHISGDIALAVRQYWYTTHDKNWLATIGFPIVYGIASFYAARLQQRPGDSSKYDYTNTIGPDEDAGPVNNSAYTNSIVRIALEFAAEAASVLGHSGDVYEDFLAKAAGLSMPIDNVVPDRPDLKGGYHPEYDGFPNTLTLHQKVKQADVVMLSYPLGVQMSKEVLANDLSFYEGATSSTGPAMTWAMFAINWFDAGDYKRSALNFLRGYANILWPFGVWSENPPVSNQHSIGSSNFITGAGGFLQSLIFGTSGMRIKHDGLWFNPPPPSATGTRATQLAIHSFHYLGSRLRQEVTSSTTRYELLEAKPGASKLVVHPKTGEAQPLVVGKPVDFGREPVVIKLAGYVKWV